MAHSALFLAAWITTGTAGLAFGMVAVALAKRRLNEPKFDHSAERPLTA